MCCGIKLKVSITDILANIFTENYKDELSVLVRSKLKNILAIDLA